ncbi:T6SS effector BTH_I2691 family protein [Orbus wheelerorum]|uniref:T6SS effector BTH_I2691 family protein n=1 Tax=Orbus wheelerorum TaxID=3074111 RepID=UPI00370DAF64
MTNAQTEKTCGCQTNGLAILPVRYTVVPTYLERQKPQWVNSSSITKVPLSTGYQYHVRSLREGYLYLYLPAEMGNNKWQVYSIDEEGHLFKQSSNATAKSASEIKESGSYQCPQLKKNSNHNSFITIENPQYQQQIYIAYSEFIWSDETLKRHEQAPEKRMQAVDPSQWKNGQSSNQSATIATQSHIEQVLDYDPKFDPGLLPYDEQHLVEVNAALNDVEAAKAPKFNYTEALSYDRKGENGNNGDKGKPYGFNEKVLNKNTTCHPWTQQQGQSQHLASTMAQYSPGYSPILLAIDDSLGIAHELNGYYNEIFAKNEQYRQERELEFNAKESYEYAMQILIQKEWMDDFKLPFTEHPYFKRVMKNKKIERSAELPVFSSYNQLSVLVYEQLYGRPKSYFDVANIAVNTDKFNASLPKFTGQDFFIIEREQFLYGRDTSPSRRDARAADYHVPGYRDFNAEKKAILFPHTVGHIEKYATDMVARYKHDEAAYQSARESDIDKLQKKYAKHLKTEAFDTQYERLITKISELAEVRVKQVIGWIKKSNFYQHIQDLNGNKWLEVIGLDEQAKEELDNQLEIELALADNEITEVDAQELKKVNLYGIIYSSIVERSTAGLELTEAGKAQIDEWFSNDKASQDNSDGLMWRAIANNSDTILIEIQQLLANAKTVDEKVTIDEVYSSTKIGKIASYYKKTQGFLNTVENYKKALKNAQEATESMPGILSVAKQLGIHPPKEGRLLKLFISRPALSINNTILRLSNIIFSPISATAQIPNTAISYLFHFSLCGVPKAGSIAFLRSQDAMNNYVLKSPRQIQVNLPGGVVGELTGAERQRILARNGKFIRIQKVYYSNTKQILNNTYRNNIQEILTKSYNTDNKKLSTIGMWKEDTKGIFKGMTSEPKASNGIKDTRLALIIGIIEAYNWWKLKQKREDLASDEFWDLEMTKSTIALSAITAEIVAQYTKVARGSESLAAGRTKIASGFLGGAVGIWSAWERYITAKSQLSQGNVKLGLLYLTNAGLYFASGMTTGFASLTYHIPWLERKIRRKALEKGISHAVLSRVLAINTAKYMAKRTLLLGAGFWIGVLALSIDVLIWYITDDEFEKWLQKSALGSENNTEKGYQKLFEQKQAFKSVLESMFGINEQVLHIDEQNQITVKNDADIESDDINDSEFNEYDALLLISQDFERQKRARASILASEQDKQQIGIKHNEEAKSLKVTGYSIPNIFS